MWIIWLTLFLSLLMVALWCVIWCLNKIDDYRYRLERMHRGLRAVEDLINDSHGVTGLHLNGDVAPWDELRRGGRYEDWLIDFDVALGHIDAPENMITVDFKTKK